jgi:hypothetical protein
MLAGKQLLPGFLQADAHLQLLIYAVPTPDTAPTRFVALSTSANVCPLLKERPYTQMPAAGSGCFAAPAAAAAVATAQAAKQQQQPQ